MGILIRAVRLTLRALVAAAFLLTALPSAGLATPLLSGPGDQFGFNDQVVIGLEFVTGTETIQVATLGYWDTDLDGLVASHDVGLWETDGTLLASVTVPVGTAATLRGEFRYVDLAAPVELQANTAYVVAGFTGAEDLYRFDTDEKVALLLPAGFSLVEGRLAFPASGLVFPNLTAIGSGNGAVSWTAANLEFGVVPEPTTGLLLFAGLAGLSASARRRTLH